MLIVLQPGAQTISLYSGLVLLGALLGAATSLMIKRLTATEGVATIVWYQALFATALALPLCLLHWRTPDPTGWLLLLAIGALGTLSWLTMTRAFFLVDASAVPTLYSGRVRPRHVFLVLLLGLLALAVAVAVTPVGQDWADTAIAWVRDQWQGPTG